jgi:hypothetical protein
MISIYDLLVLLMAKNRFGLFDGQAALLNLSPNAISGCHTVIASTARSVIGLSKITKTPHHLQ